MSNVELASYLKAKAFCLEAARLPARQGRPQTGALMIHAEG